MKKTQLDSGKLMSDARDHAGVGIVVDRKSEKLKAAGRIGVSLAFVNSGGEFETLQLWKLKHIWVKERSPTENREPGTALVYKRDHRFPMQTQ